MDSTAIWFTGIAGVCIIHGSVLYSETVPEDVRDLSIASKA